MAALRKLPPEVQNKAVPSAGNFAMTPVLKTAKNTAPLGLGLTPAGNERPHLRESLRKKRKTYKQTGTSVITVGHVYRETPHAHLVHDGTKPHRITADHGRALKIGPVLIRGTVLHPGAKPNPYLTQALDSNEAAVKQRFADKLGREIDKHAKKLAGGGK